VCDPGVLRQLCGGAGQPALQVAQRDARLAVRVDADQNDAMRAADRGARVLALRLGHDLFVALALAALRAFQPDEAHGQADIRVETVELEPPVRVGVDDPLRHHAVFRLESVEHARHHFPPAVNEVCLHLCAPVLDKRAEPAGSRTFLRL